MNPPTSNSGQSPKLQHLTMPKTWILAKRKLYQEAQKRTNETVETKYTSILNKAKRQLSQSTQPIFERDYRKDRTESIFTMHCFMSKDFYWYLECDILYHYRVEYAFNGYPLEDEVRAILNAYPFDTRSTGAQLKPDFNTFYTSVLHYQDQKHISIPGI